MKIKALNFDAKTNRGAVVFSDGKGWIFDASFSAVTLYRHVKLTSGEIVQISRHDGHLVNLVSNAIA